MRSFSSRSRAGCVGVLRNGRSTKVFVLVGVMICSDLKSLIGVSLWIKDNSAKSRNFWITCRPIGSRAIRTIANRVLLGTNVSVRGSAFGKRWPGARAGATTSG